MRTNNPCIIVPLLKEYLLYSSVIPFLFLFGCDNADEVEPDAGTSDTDTDTDSDTEPDDEDSMDMNCDEGYLFNYGHDTVELQYENYNGWYTASSYDFEYDEDKKPIRALVRAYYEDGEILAEYERTYIYDENGRLDRMEWVQQYTDGTPDLAMERRYIYDEQGRTLREEYYTEYDGKMTLTSFSSWEYGNDGIVLRSFYDGPDEDLEYEWGSRYEYDEEGKKTKRIVLDPDNDWAETELTTEYQYHPDGRILKKITTSFDYYYGYLEEEEMDYTYVGDTPIIVEAVGTNGELETYEWDGLTLTITYLREDGSKQRWIYNYTFEGSSFFWEIFPNPPSEFPLYDYGNGYINGCIGQ